MKRFITILACLAAISCFYAQETSTEEIVNPKNPMDRSVQVITPEEQHIPTNLATGNKKPASVRIEYIENYDEVHIYYTCLDVSFDKADAIETVHACLEDFRKEHDYVKYDYIRRDKVRHYRDERGIKMGEMLSIVHFTR